MAEDLRRHPVVDAGANKLGPRQSCALRFRRFFERVSQEFPHVIHVAGNHEFYDGKWVETLLTLREESRRYPNVHFLERDAVVIDGITFVGGTLWTDLNRGDPLTMHVVGEGLNDYRLIRNDQKGYTRLRPVHSGARHRETANYIRDVVEQDPTKAYVVVTHHAPSTHSIHPKYAHQTHMNGGYASNMDDFIIAHPQIRLWAHGHLHSVSDYVVGTTRVVCNPRGYEGYEDDTGWDSSKVVQVYP